MPQAAQPVNRTTTGLLPPELAELSEEALQLHELHGEHSTSVLASGELPGVDLGWICMCSYDGDDAE
ncbi:MAG: DUF5837 family cyanobactin class RiPP [Nostoc sp.]